MSGIPATPTTAGYPVAETKAVEMPAHSTPAAPSIETFDSSAVTPFGKAGFAPGVFSVPGLKGFEVLYDSIVQSLVAGQTTASATHKTGVLLGRHAGFLCFRFNVTGVASFLGEWLQGVGVLTDHQAQTTASAMAFGGEIPVGQVFVSQSNPAQNPAELLQVRVADLRRTRISICGKTLGGHRTPSQQDKIDYVNALLSIFETKHELLEKHVRTSETPLTEANKVIGIPLEGAGVFGWDKQQAAELTMIAWAKFRQDHTQTRLAKCRLYTTELSVLAAFKGAVGAGFTLILTVASLFDGSVALVLPRFSSAGKAFNPVTTQNLLDSEGVRASNQAVQTPSDAIKAGKTACIMREHGVAQLEQLKHARPVLPVHVEAPGVR